MMIEVMPSDDDEVSEVMPAIVDSWRSIGAATEAGHGLRARARQLSP